MLPDEMGTSHREGHDAQNERGVHVLEPLAAGIRSKECSRVLERGQRNGPELREIRVPGAKGDERRDADADSYSNERVAEINRAITLGQNPETLRNNNKDRKEMRVERDN